MSRFESNILERLDRPARSDCGVAGEPKGEPQALPAVRIASADLCVAPRQIATLLRAGMNLVPALSAVVEQVQGQPLEGVLQRVRDRVNSGNAMSDALGRDPQVFSRLYVSMVKTGEASGTLDQILIKLAQMLENRSRLASKVKSALAYPLLMAGMAVTVVMFLMAFVIPNISNIFLDMDQELPSITVTLMAVSAFVQNKFWVIFIAALLMVAGIRMYLRSDTGSLVWDRSKLKLPLLGDFFLKIEAVRLMRTLSVLLSSGVSILYALRIVKEVVQNRYMAKKLDGIGQAIGDGDSIARALKRTDLFAPIVYHMIAVGELSGNVEEGLRNIADAYEEEVELKLKTLTALFEPIVMMSMGVVVGFIVLAMLLPIFEINQAI